MRTVVGGLFVVLFLFMSEAAWAQQIEIEAPTPERPRPPLVLPPGDQFEKTRPPDYNNYVPPPDLNYDPAFIEPLSKKVETPAGPGRIGVGGWVSPNTRIGAEATGSRSNHDPGWFALGFIFEWGGPPTQPSPPVKRPPLR